MFRRREIVKDRNNTPRRLYQLRSLTFVAPVIAAGVFAMFLINNPFASMEPWSESDRPSNQGFIGTSQPQTLKSELVLSESNQTGSPEAIADATLPALNNDPRQTGIAENIQQCDETKKSVAEQAQRESLEVEDLLHKAKLDAITKLLVMVNPSDHAAELKRHAKQITIIDTTYDDALAAAHCRG